MKKITILFMMIAHACFSMDSSKDFVWNSDKGRYQFRVVDFADLPPIDHANFVAHTHDHEAMVDRFGVKIANIFQEWNGQNTETVYNAMVKMYSTRSPQTHWFIDCLDLDNAFVGHLSLTTPQVESQKNKSDTVEVGLSLAKDYRHIGIATDCVLPVLKILSSFKDFDGKSIVVATIPENIQVHKLAEKCGFTNVGPFTKKDFDLGIFKISLELDLFVGKFG